MQPARKLVDYSKQRTYDTHRGTKKYRKVKRRRRLPETMVVFAAAILLTTLALTYLGQQVYTMHLNVTRQRLEQRLHAEKQKHEQLLVSFNAARSLRNIETIAIEQLGMVAAGDPVHLAIYAPVVDPLPLDVMMAHEVETGPYGLFAGVADLWSQWLSLGGVNTGSGR